jgi:hypothetical protein
MRKKPDAAEATPGQVTFGEPIAGPNIAGHGLPAILSLHREPDPH